MQVNTCMSSHEAVAWRRYNGTMGTGDRAARRCLDCAGELLVGQSFCGHCGQRTDLARLTLHEVGHEFVHALVHADRSALSLLLSLLLRPGVVAREYVAGKRRRHFGPFSSLVVLIGATTLLSELVGFESITSSRALNGVQDFLNGHVNLIVFAQIPLLTFLCSLLFRRDRFDFVEHMVLVAYTSGLRAMLFALIVLPLWYFLHPDMNLVGESFWALWSFYFGIAAAQFYSGNRFLSWLKGALAAFVIYPATGLLINAIAAGFQYLRGL
jgi:hypothetical protein